MRPTVWWGLNLSRSLDLPQTAGLQCLWLASRLKPWLRTTDGLWWLATAYEYKKINRSKLAQSHQFMSYVKSNTENSNDAVGELALEK